VLGLLPPLLFLLLSSTYLSQESGDTCRYVDRTAAPYLISVVLFLGSALRQDRLSGLVLPITVMYFSSRDVRCF
jgi:hypothetical protein